MHLRSSSPALTSSDQRRICTYVGEELLVAAVVVRLCGCTCVGEQRVVVAVVQCLGELVVAAFVVCLGELVVAAVVVCLGGCAGQRRGM